jgi:hypothetical protein
MNRLLKVLLIVGVVALVLSAAGTLALVAWPGTIGHAVVAVGDHEVVLSDLYGGGALLALAGLVVAVVLAVVVPLAVAVPLLAVGVGLAFGFVAVAGTVALLMSPLILVGWLVWRLTRPSRSAPLATS